MEELYFLGFGCMFFSAFLSLKYAVQGFSNINLEDFHKNANRGSIIAGIGALAFIFHGIYTHNYIGIALSTLAMVVNVYLFWDRNNNLEE